MPKWTDDFAGATADATVKGRSLTETDGAAASVWAETNAPLNDQVYASPEGGVKIKNSGSAGTAFIGTNSTTARQPNYATLYVEFDLIVRGNTGQGAGCFLRDKGIGSTATFGERGYWFRYYTGNCEIYEYDSSTYTLRAQGAWTPTLGTSYRMRFECTDAKKAIYVDGVEKCTTSSNVLASSGTQSAIALWLACYVGTASDTNGAFVDNFLVQDSLPVSAGRVNARRRPLGLYTR